MARRSDPTLQPLRISTGWKVVWNSFYEVDPPEEHDAIEWLYLSEDLLLLSNQQRRVLVDISWRPYGPKGRFVLSAINWVGAAEMPDEWAAPLMQYLSRSRLKIVERCEKWISDDMDWSAIKRKHKARAKEPLEQTYTRNQKLYEQEVE
jgi:hypothetical protein